MISSSSFWRRALLRELKCYLLLFQDRKLYSVSYYHFTLFNLIEANIRTIYAWAEFEGTLISGMCPIIIHHYFQHECFDCALFSSPLRAEYGRLATPASFLAADSGFYLNSCVRLASTVIEKMIWYFSNPDFPTFLFHLKLSQCVSVSHRRIPPLHLQTAAI